MNGEKGTNNKLWELLIDMATWSLERTPSIYDEFAENLRRCAIVRDIDVELVFSEIEKWKRT